MIIVYHSFPCHLKLNANQLVNVFIFTHRHCRQIKVSFVLASVAHDVTDQTPIWAVFFCAQKNKSNLNCPQATFIVFIHVPFLGTDYLSWLSYLLLCDLRDTEI